jgi:hypothetical protein
MVGQVDLEFKETRLMQKGDKVSWVLQKVVIFEDLNKGLINMLRMALGFSRGNCGKKKWSSSNQF